MIFEIHTPILRPQVMTSAHLQQVLHDLRRLQSRLGFRLYHMNTNGCCNRFALLTTINRRPRCCAEHFYVNLRFAGVYTPWVIEFQSFTNRGRLPACLNCRYLLYFINDCLTCTFIYHFIFTGTCLWCAVFSSNRISTDIHNWRKCDVFLFRLELILMPSVLLFPSYVDVIAAWSACVLICLMYSLYPYRGSRIVPNAWNMPMSQVWPLRLNDANTSERIMNIFLCWCSCLRESSYMHCISCMRYKHSCLFLIFWKGETVLEFVKIVLFGSHKNEHCKYLR